jgi:hypothetical protein
MRIIRASEVNTFLYCRRAWFYHLKGIQPANQTELKAGTQLHYHHGRMVAGAGILKILAFCFFLAAVFLVIKLLVH